MVRAIVFFSFLFISMISHADKEDINDCLKGWGKHPFGEKPQYRTLNTSVKILGIGKKIADNTQTKKPALVLVKPSVNVLSKSTMKLLNPNGWYCLKANVGVLGKTTIEIDCKAKLALGDGQAVTVLGSQGKGEETGIAILGKTQVKRLNCKN